MWRRELILIITTTLKLNFSLVFTLLIVSINNTWSSISEVLFLFKFFYFRLITSDTVCDIHSVSIKLEIAVQWRLHSADPFLLQWKTSDIKAKLRLFSLVCSSTSCIHTESRGAALFYQKILQHLPFHMSALLLFILQISHCYKGLCQQGEESFAK